MTQSTTERQQQNGVRPIADSPRIDPRPGRRSRLPELSIGIVLMVASALGAVLWHMSSTSKQPVLALANPVERGEVIEAADLRVVYIEADNPIAHLPERSSATVVGRIAVTDLDSGTLLSSALVTERTTLGDGEGVVGLSLDPGQFPALGLLPGDRVNVVGTATPSDDSEGSTTVLARAADVFAVEDLGTQGRQFISLRMSEDDANLVAATAERSPVRLVLVGS